MLDDIAATRARPKRLFSIPGVALATVLGSPIAGGLILFINEKRLGRTARGAVVFIGSVLVLIGFVALSLMVPEHLNVPNIVFLAPQIALVYFVGKWLQGDEIAAHVEAGGALSSKWKAAVIGLACALVLLAMLFVGAMAAYIIWPDAAIFQDLQAE